MAKSRNVVRKSLKGGSFMDPHRLLKKFCVLLPGLLTRNFLFKCGTSKLHGDAYWFGRNDALDSHGFFPSRLPVEKLNEFCASGNGMH